MFSFHSDLFEYRTKAMEVLSHRGIEWLEHYSAIDLLHNEFGLEVCGIKEKENGTAILRILKNAFSEWPCTEMYYRDYERDRGWKVIICKRRIEGENWKSA